MLDLLLELVECVVRLELFADLEQLRELRRVFGDQEAAAGQDVEHADRDDVGLIAAVDVDVDACAVVDERQLASVTGGAEIAGAAAHGLDALPFTVAPNTHAEAAERVDVVQSLLGGGDLGDPLRGVDLSLLAARSGQEVGEALLYELDDARRRVVHALERQDLVEARLGLLEGLLTDRVERSVELQEELAVLPRWPRERRAHEADICAEPSALVVGQLDGVTLRRVAPGGQVHDVREACRAVERDVRIAVREQPDVLAGADDGGGAVCRRIDLPHDERHTLGVTHFGDLAHVVHHHEARRAQAA